MVLIENYNLLKNCLEFLSSYYVEYSTEKCRRCDVLVSYKINNFIKMNRKYKNNITTHVDYLKKFPDLYKTYCGLGYEYTISKKNQIKKLVYRDDEPTEKSEKKTIIKNKACKPKATTTPKIKKQITKGNVTRSNSEVKVKKPRKPSSTKLVHLGTIFKNKNGMDSEIYQIGLRICDKNDTNIEDIKDCLFEKIIGKVEYSNLKNSKIGDSYLINILKDKLKNDEIMLEQFFTFKKLGELSQVESVNITLRTNTTLKKDGFWIYHILLINKKSGQIDVSDPISLMSYKQLTKRQNKSYLENQINLMKDNKESLFPYLFNSMHIMNEETGEYQLRDVFTFDINFYQNTELNPSIDAMEGIIPNITTTTTTTEETLPIKKMKKEEQNIPVQFNEKENIWNNNGNDSGYESEDVPYPNPMEVFGNDSILSDIIGNENFTKLFDNNSFNSVINNIDNTLSNSADKVLSNVSEEKLSNEKANEKIVNEKPKDKINKNGNENTIINQGFPSPSNSDYLTFNDKNNDLNIENKIESGLQTPPKEYKTSFENELQNLNVLGKDILPNILQNILPNLSLPTFPEDGFRTLMVIEFSKQTSLCDAISRLKIYYEYHNALKSQKTQELKDKGRMMSKEEQKACYGIIEYCKNRMALCESASFNCQLELMKSKYLVDSYNNSNNMFNDLYNNINNISQFNPVTNSQFIPLTNTQNQNQNQNQGINTNIMENVDHSSEKKEEEEKLKNNTLYDQFYQHSKNNTLYDQFYQHSNDLNDILSNLNIQTNYNNNY